MELRDCQKAAIACFQERLLGGEFETNLSLCTGAGKSEIIRVITDAIPKRRIIVFPWLSLLSQYYNKYGEVCKSCPCVRYFATEGTLEDVARLSDNKGELAESEYVIFTTYSSAPKLYDELIKKNCNVDLVCHDEAHRTERPDYSAKFQSISQHIGHTVNFSATLPASKTAHYKYPLLRGIKDGVVRDFHMKLFMCSSAERRDTNLIVTIVNKLKALHKQVKLLIYTSEANTDGPDASSVKTFLDTHMETLKGHGWWVEGIKADTKDRSEILYGDEGFEKHREVSVLVSCKTLSEGIDLKGANCMLPWDPSNSITDNIQRIGRVLRLYKNADGTPAKHQPASTVLIPVFLEEEKYLSCGGNTEKVSAMLSEEIGQGERGNFRSIVNVCTALKSELALEDEELYNQLLNYPNRVTVSVDRSLVECVAKKCKKPAETILDEIADDLAANLDEEELDNLREGEWDEEIGDDVINALAKTQNLTLTVTNDGDTDVIGNGSVHIHVERKKDNYVVVAGKKEAKDAAKKHIAHRMTCDYSDGCRILLGLQSVEGADAMGGMVLTRLTTEVQVDEKWEERLAQWVEQYTRLGRNPVVKSKDLNEKRAGIWQSNQRQLYMQNKLSDERIIRLNETIGWKWKEDDAWELNRQHWIQQRQKLGRNPLLNSKDVDDKRACQWQSDQRKYYRTGKLLQSRIDKLDNTQGWKWEEEDTWEPQRQHWIEQYEKIGRKPSEISKDQDEKRAGQWQAVQRRNYWNKENCMTQERIDILNGTPGWTWEKEDTWEPNRQHWIQQYQKLGRYPSDKSKDSDEKRAGSWQRNQCNNYKKKEKCMTPERITILENTPGWKWEEDDTWELNRQHWIKQYKKLGRKPTEISKDLDEKRAGMWQQRQRCGYRKNVSWITIERIRILNNTPNWSWEDDSWEAGRQHWIYQKQKLGRNPNKHAKDVEEKRSGIWQSRQRQAYKNKDTWLTQERIEILNGTPCWTWSSKDVPVIPAPPPLASTPAAKAPRIRRLKLSTATFTPTGHHHVPSQLEQFHKRFKTMNASTYKSTITPTEFAEYHEIADSYDARDPPERQPINKIANLLAKYNRPTYNAIDLGCGKNRLRHHPQVSRMNWTSVDVHAADDTVTVADMAALPYEEDSYDFAILGRSLWARNHMDVLAEVYRILKSSGRAIICESFRRWLVAAAGAGGDAPINGLVRDLVAAGFEIIHEEGTAITDTDADVFQYIIVRKP